MTDQRATMTRVDDRHGTVHVEDVYDTDIDDLWSAITTPERVSRWIADVEGDLRPNGLIHVRFVSSFEGPGRIDVCEPPHRLLLRMQPDSEDETVIEALLTGVEGGTRLVVEERGLPLDELHLHGAGWQAHLEDLGRHFASQPSEWKQRWDELVPTYTQLPIR